MTKDQLDKIIQRAIDDNTPFPYLLTHCPRALALLDALLKAGQDTHEPMDWVELGPDGNKQHAIDHIRAMSDKHNLNLKHEDHWLNAVCRLLFVVELREAVKEQQQVKQ